MVAAMARTDSALDPEAIRRAKALLAPPPPSDSLAPMAIGAALFAMAAMGLLMAMILMWPMSHGGGTPHHTVATAPR